MIPASPRSSPTQPDPEGKSRVWANGNMMIALICLVAFGIGSVIWVNVASRVADRRAAAVANVLRSNGNLVIAHKEKVKAGLAHFEQILQAVAEIDTSAATPTDPRPRLNQLLSKAQETAPELISLAVIAADGATRATTQASSSLNVSDRPYFQRHQEFRSTRVDVGAPFTGMLTGRWTVPITRRIETPEGKFLGVACLSIDPAYFAQPFVSSKQGAHDAMVVLGRMASFEPFVSGIVFSTGRVLRSHHSSQRSVRTRVAGFERRARLTVTQSWSTTTRFPTTI